ncbi:leucine-rich repeat and IQ domain-containing protein 1-like [Anneissia japonica]|uniref:leucine-rich repeat and IQ domain-containing protein 1-like n=1 Tax=Anneissia japonica TaxID=1529436 RepID=UPI001425A7E5|nr:leucine-rich repeat and IQ domain-containing protein 1-like [Anneissia japonica]
MSMKGRQNPLGDEEDWIDDEIQRQLDALDVNDLEHDEEQPVKDDIEDLEDDIPDTVSAYLLRVQSRTEGFVKELAECDQVLKIIPANNEDFYYNSKELNELAFILGEDPEELRDRVIIELENEDSADAQNSRTTNQKQGEGESYHEQQHTDSYEITEENGKLALIHDADILEQAAQKQIRELEEKHRARNMVAQKEHEMQLRTDARKEKEKEEVRQQMKETYEKEQREMVQTRKVHQERIEEELHKENKEFEVSLQQYEQEIQEFSQKVEEEKKVFDEERHLREAKKEQQEKEAATLIQSVFRSYRTRKPYLKRLQKMREDLKEKREQERQCEILANRRKEEQRKKKEIMEKKRKQEEERIRKEEQLKKEEEERKEKERKRLEKEEQERLQEEQLEKERMEKEKLKREEEERERMDLERKEKEILAKIQAEKEKIEQEKKLMKEKVKEEKAEVEMQSVMNQEIGSKIELSDEQVKKEKNKSNCPLEEASIIKDSNSADKCIETLMQNFINKDLTKEVHQEPENKKPDNASSQDELPSAVQGAPSCTDNSDKSHKNLFEVNTPKSDASVNEAAVKVVPGFTFLPPLPEILEAKRLKWMQDCIPFSKIQGQVKVADQKIVHRQKRRPTSAKKLQPLTKELLLSASPLQTSLAQVTTVRLSDLPGCSLTSLDQCHDLIAMEIRNCNLVALEGLENLPNVKYIDVENNKIEYINCKDRKNLASLNLSCNNLTVVHGLEGCSELRRLDASHNKIAKLGCVASFSNMQVLNMSHNQLMTSQGLRSLALLQHLDLSNNHLSQVDGLENCCLLQKLNLASNNLSQIPPLQNHVLLQEINMCNNSVNQMDALVDCWLPSLQHLNLSDNSLEEIAPSLHGLPFLRTLDIRHNFISEIEKLSGLEILKKLDHLHIEGNAVNEESSYKSYVLSLLPSLQYLDSEKIERDGLIKDCVSQFEASCESQRKAQEILTGKWKKDFELLKNQGDLVKLADLEQTHLEQMEKMMKEHRYMHEYGDTTIIEPTQVVDSQVTPNQVAASQVPANQVTTSQVPANNVINPSNITLKSAEMRNVKVEKSDRRTGVITTKALVQQTQGKRHTDQAATLIQAHWRGYCIRRDIHDHTKQWLAAVTIQACCRGYLARKKVKNMRASIGKQTGVYNNARHMSAATTIQAWWRGNKTRHFMRNARQQAVQGLEDDEDFFDHEIDLSSFDYVESDWRPSDEPRLPQSHPVLPSQYHPSPPSKDRPPSRTVRHAWRNINSPQQYNTSTADILVVDHTNTPRETDTEMTKDTPRNTLMGKPPLPPLSSLSGNTLKTTRSEKQEQISEEWGFRDGNTAALMMKRAQKMRGKKKINDPMQRLKMMKKLQDTSRQQPIQVSKKGIQRKEYFQVRAEEKEQTSRKQIEEKNQRTFEWLHSQVNSPNDTKLNSKGMKERHASSEPSLPRMSPDVLQGRVQLVASPSLELQSVDSRSVVTASPHRHRSHSFSSPDGDKIQFSMTKTNSAPTNHTRLRLEAKAKHKGH